MSCGNVGKARTRIAQTENERRAEAYPFRAGACPSHPACVPSARPSAPPRAHCGTRCRSPRSRAARTISSCPAWPPTSGPHLAFQKTRQQ
eukprot:3235654-Rhodomonas_salina.3